MKFDALGLKDELLEAISFMGFEKATPIQELAIPIIMEGNDLIACAQTGTGKTAAFLLPLMDRIVHETERPSSTLILVPTRELAIQIDQQVQGLAYTLGITSISIYGGGDGEDWGQEKIALTQGADIIVATPGKLISHLNMGYVRFETIRFLVLDEADRMLDIGFIDDIIKIISYLPKERQTLMFSATMAQKIRDLAQKILRNPEEISIALAKPAEGVLQAVYPVFDHQKNDLITHLVADKSEYESILVFCSTKKKVTEVARAIKKIELNTEWISSDLEQTERENVILKFKARKTRILVATDVLSRGIDIKEINLIINYDVPRDAEDYVHRVGRTARADSTGVALTLCNEDDMAYVEKIERLIENKIYKVRIPESLGESPVWKSMPPRPYKRRHFKGKGKR